MFSHAFARLITKLDMEIFDACEYPVRSGEFVVQRIRLREEHLARFNGGYVRDMASRSALGSASFLVFDTEDDALAFVLSV